MHIIKYITKGSLEEDMRRLATNKLKLDSEVSGQDNGAAPVDDENNRHQVEKKMRTSLLSNLKKRFEGETQASQSGEGAATSQVVPVAVKKEDPDTAPDVVRKDNTDTAPGAVKKEDPDATS